MQRVATVNGARQLIADVKGAGSSFFTNFYLQDGAIARAIETGRLFARTAGCCAVIVIRQALFDRLYYACSDLDSLGPALAGAPLPPSGAVVSDVLGTPTQIEPVLTQFMLAGFARYTEFQSMQRLGAGTVPPPSDPDLACSIATERDARSVLDAIERHFDPFCEHIPEMAEVLEAVLRGTILLAKHDGEIASLLYYDRLGATALLRYWLVLPSFRGRGYGDVLMQRYFYECREARRFKLWVQATNRRAIPLYTSYGYAPVPTVDVILRKTGQAHA